MMRLHVFEAAYQWEEVREWIMYCVFGLIANCVRPI